MPYSFRSTRARSQDVLIPAPTWLLLVRLQLRIDAQAPVAVCAEVAFCQPGRAAQRRCGFVPMPIDDFRRKEVGLQLDAHVDPGNRLGSYMHCPPRHRILSSVTSIPCM